ncbi:MAG: hypothetical protein M3340_17170, partial [Actinomycetota bacterium]|nr:hypothetical protein [Actinomycetota bacterium]
PLLRALGAAAVLIAIAYAVTPGSAGGSPDEVPHLVLWNMRHLTPALALGLVCLPLVSGKRWVLPLFAAVFAATQLSGGVFELWGARPTTVAILGGLGAVALAAVAGRMRGRMALAAAAVLAGGAIGAGAKAHDIYFEHRYTDSESPLGAAYSWAREVSDARIGVVGSFLQHPLYGNDLSNHVQYVGVAGGDGEFRSVASCAEWRERLADGDYDFVVTAPFNYPWGASSAYPREARWTETDRNAIQLGRLGPVAIFELRADPDPSTCARDGFPAREREAEQETGTRPPTD